MSVVLSLDQSLRDVVNEQEELSSTISDLQSLLMELLKTNGPAWAPLISQWTLTLLGDMSSTHAQLIIKVNFHINKMNFKQFRSTSNLFSIVDLWFKM